MLANAAVEEPNNHPHAARIPKTANTVHCAAFALDIAGFGTYPDEVHTHLRTVLYETTEKACDDAGLPWISCYREDRGDGLLVIAPGYLGADIIVDSVASHIHAGLRRHNRRSSDHARIRVRMAVHAGYIRLDEHGVAGRCVIDLFRLLDATELKDALTISGASFVMAASDYLYNEVIRHGPGLIDPGAYRPIMIHNKETHAPAWLWLPPRNQPAGSAPAGRPFALSRGEIEVARLMLAGWSRKKIAKELHLPRETVDQHIRRTLAELCLTMTSPTGIAAAFKQNGPY